MANPSDPPFNDEARAREYAEKAWHYLYGDGNDAAIGQGMATLAVAHATLAVATRTRDLLDGPIADAAREHALRRLSGGDA